MSLSQKIAAALDPRAGVQNLPCDISVEDGAHQLMLRVTASGPVGVAFDRLTFRTAQRPEWSTENLSAWGDRIATRLTYLMEPLVLLEIDAIGREAELRSQQPTTRDGQSAYYEIRLNHQGTLRFNRVAFDQASRRRTTAVCHMTLEALERLADDLAASV